MVSKCRLFCGRSCPISRKENEKCCFYDPDGNWCYYAESIRDVE